MIWGITGASGFIGRHLVAHLRTRPEIALRLFGRTATPIDGLAVAPLAGDLRVFAGIDTLFHLAGIAGGGASDDAYDAVNRELTVAALRAAAEAGVRRFVFMSTLHVHGRWSPQPVGPHSAFDPPNAYARSKIAAEREIAALAPRLGIEWAVLRPPLVYGRGARGNFAQMAALARKGLPFPRLPQDNRRSMISAGNLVHALEHMASHAAAAGKVLLPADERDPSTRAFAALVSEAAGRRPRFAPLPALLVRAGLIALGRGEAYDGLYRSMAIDRMHWRDVNWFPPESIEDGMKKALA
jgi:nucleoside-diphosphate-sugar epimerase